VLAAVQVVGCDFVKEALRALALACPHQHVLPAEFSHNSRLSGASMLQIMRLPDGLISFIPTNSRREFDAWPRK
jgi:hypothetical protein